MISIKVGDNMILIKRSILFIFTTAFICFFWTNGPNINSKGKIDQAFMPINTSTNNSNDINPMKFVYLTFDDGPTFIVTDAILDELKKANVKATFFVVGKEIEGKEKILTRIYNEGHSIGLHTYSHNFKKIYRSSEDFINEMKKASDKIEQVTGFAPKIIRFPGGSSKRLNSHSLEALHKNNFKVFDWNVNVDDGINPNLTPDLLVKNSHTIKGNKNVAIILMHCNFNNRNTVKALPQIIKYYHDLGYNFKTINDDTPEYYYRFEN
ncbi:polysaccharide deacetylase family protein [Clostridium sp.]|jgi:peptidoglycan/xylan/chitin deacetylase (PgdA/CDA1 family)|uniref:polysaccharide deacetylase family protein n=1 Tax=Clostridium sp. TaxID=1506 RepID=UPI003EEA12D6